MISTLYLIVFFYIILELFELQWQKSDTMMGMLVQMHKKYDTNVVVFLLYHPTFMFAIWLIMVTGFSIASVALLLIKTIDIATKIILIQQLFEKRQLSQELSVMLLTPLHPAMPYLGLIAYSPMVYLSLLG